MDLKIIIFCVFVIFVGVSIATPHHDRKIDTRRNHYFDIKWKSSETSCGYESCTKPDPSMLNVHIVPHTHDDVGWLKTVDQYYYGSKTLIQKAGVQYILDSVIQQLLSDPAKRFIYVESAFFFKWWNKQTDSLKAQVYELVQEGRLEFIGGAWSMNDEATTHYQSVIDQFTWGLRKLNDTFGECGRPRVGWQIDPFGHSREMASMFARMGFDGMFFGRLDYQDKINRLSKKKAEMLWHGSANLGEAADLFTGVLYNNYGPPPGFCFDILCSDEPMIDDKWSPDYNVDRKVDDFAEYVTEMSEHYKTNNVILTMGEDFNYQDANMWFKNLDKLIKYTNDRQVNGSKINLFYSTPSCYLKSLHEAKIEWPTKSDDFFPYSSDPSAFWTGYFTSRPTLKRFERVGNHFLQICKQLTVLAPKQENHFNPHLSFLREQMGIMQHHDAVTGTEKQKVADDYARRLDLGIASCSGNIKSALNQFTLGSVTDNETSETDNFKFSNCLNLNISACEISENNNNFIVTVYNPLSHARFQHIRVPVTDTNYKVTDYRGIPTPAQFVSVPESVKSLEFRKSNADYELVFLAIEIPPLGYKSYYISKNSNKNPEVMLMDQPAIKEDVVIGNKYLNIAFDKNGFLTSITTEGVTNPLSQKFFYYKGASGDNKEFTNRSSGAYIFRPNGTEYIISEKADLKVIKGDLVDEVHQVFNEWISQVIRVYKVLNYVEFEWMVGPIPINDSIGKEIISRFSTNIESAGTFYTDSNGREMLKRQRNHRETWDVSLAEKIAGNYYPVTTKIALEDKNARLAILTDRSQGGSSLADGDLELMVHRRLLYDDAFGVDEALNELAYGNGLVARGHHYLFFGSSHNEEISLKARERFGQLEQLLPCWSFFSESKLEFVDWSSTYTNIHSGLAQSLPQNIHLMSMEPWKENSFLIRFEHILEATEDKEYSKSVSFYMTDILQNFDIENIRETNLAGNQWIEDVNRLKFNSNDGEKDYKSFTFDTAQLKTDFKVTLGPMEIKTFIIFLNPQI